MRVRQLLLGLVAPKPHTVRQRTPGQNRYQAWRDRMRYEREKAARDAVPLDPEVKRILQRVKTGVSGWTCDRCRVVTYGFSTECGRCGKRRGFK